MIIYHGSNEIVGKPEYGKGKPYNDYGKGFYCTPHIELAKEWAVNENIDGYVNEYELNIDNLKVLNLLDDKYNVLHWLAILINNRHFEMKSPIIVNGSKYLEDNYLLDLNGYDVVIGNRADDSYFAFAKDFLSNTITVEQLSYAMELGSLKEQIVLISKKAFKHIEYIKNEKVDNNIYFPKRNERDNQARREYFDSLNTFVMNGIYLKDLMDGKKYE